MVSILLLNPHNNTTKQELLFSTFYLTCPRSHSQQEAAVGLTPVYNTAHFYTLTFIPTQEFSFQSCMCIYVQTT